MSSIFYIPQDISRHVGDVPPDFDGIRGVAVFGEAGLGEYFLGFGHYVPGSYGHSESLEQWETVREHFEIGPGFSAVPVEQLPGATPQQVPLRSHALAGLGSSRVLLLDTAQPLGVYAMTDDGIGVVRPENIGQLPQDQQDRFLDTLREFKDRLDRIVKP